MYLLAFLLAEMGSFSRENDLLVMWSGVGKKGRKKVELRSKSRCFVSPWACTSAPPFFLRAPLGQFDHFSQTEGELRDFCLLCSADIPSRLSPPVTRRVLNAGHPFVLMDS